MTHQLGIIPAWKIAALLILAMAGGWEIGRRIGTQRRRACKGTETGKFGDSTLALLGLLLAFTFSLSLSKHEQRRSLAVEESNAIGDFYTTAAMLKDPIRSNLQGVIRDYLQSRLDLVKNPVSEQAMEADLRHIQESHTRMTELVSQAIDDRTPVVVPLTNTLNAVTSVHASRVAAFRDRLPGPILLLLFFAAIAAIFLAGREQGLTGNLQIPGTAAFILVVSLTVYVTLDLNQPRRGFITVSQAPLEDLLRSMPPK